MPKNSKQYTIIEGGLLGVNHLTFEGEGGWWVWGGGVI